MAVTPKTIEPRRPRPVLPTVVQARDPKVIARERAAARLAIPQPTVMRETDRPHGNETAATSAEIAEAIRFAGDASRPATCMMAQIAAERIILHLEARGFVLVATNRKPPRRR